MGSPQRNAAVNHCGHERRPPAAWGAACGCVHTKCVISERVPAAMTASGTARIVRIQIAKLSGSNLYSLPTSASRMDPPAAAIARIRSAVAQMRSAVTR